MKKFTGRISVIKNKVADYITDQLICHDIQKDIINYAVQDLIHNMRVKEITKYHACNYGIAFDITYSEAEYKNGNLKVTVSVDNITTGNIEIHHRITGALIESVESGSIDIINKYNLDKVYIAYSKTSNEYDFIKV